MCEHLKTIQGKLTVRSELGDAMRFALTTAIFWLALAPTAFATKIAPGMKLEAVKTILQKHGYEVDALKYGLAIASDDQNIALDFCRIDSEITLVMNYDLRDEAVTALEFYFIPERRTAQTRVVVREALEVDGAYTLKLKRKAYKAD